MPCLAEKAPLALGGGERGFCWQRSLRLKATVRLRDTKIENLKNGAVARRHRERPQATREQLAMEARSLLRGQEQQESCYAGTGNVGRSCRDRYRRRRLLVSPYALVVSGCAGGEGPRRETG